MASFVLFLGMKMRGEGESEAESEGESEGQDEGQGQCDGESECQCQDENDGGSVQAFCIHELVESDDWIRGGAIIVFVPPGNEIRIHSSAQKLHDVYMRSHYQSIWIVGFPILSTTNQEKLEPSARR